MRKEFLIMKRCLHGALATLVAAGSLLPPSALPEAPRVSDKLVHVAMYFVLMAAAVWLGLSGAAMQGQLFGISLFVDRLPPRPARYARLVADLLVLLIAAQVIRAAYAQISTARFTTFLTLGWPKWIVSAGLLAAMVLLIGVQLQAIWRCLRGADDAGKGGGNGEVAQ